MTEPQGPNADHGYWGQPCWGLGGTHGDSLLHLVSPDIGQPASCHSKGARPVLWGLGDSHEPSQDMLGPQPAGRLWERNLFLFGWIHWPLSLNKGTRVQPWPAHFVHLLLQPEAGKDLGSSRKEEPVTATRGE